MTVYFALNLSTAVVHFYTLVYIHAQRARTEVARSFLRLEGFVLLWCTFALIPQLTANPWALAAYTRLSPWTWLFIGPCFLHFSRTLRRRPTGGAVKGAYALSIAAGALASTTPGYLEGFQSTPFGPAELNGPMQLPMALLCGLAPIGLGTAELLVAMWRSTNPSMRSTYGAIAGSALGSALLAVMTNTGSPLIAPPGTFPQLGVATSAFFSAAIFWTVRRQSLLGLFLPEELAELFERAGQGIALVSAGGDLLRVNLPARRIAARVYGDPSDLSIDRLRALPDGEHELSNGFETVWVDLRRAELREGTTLRAALLLLRDVSEHRGAEVLVQQRNLQLQQAQQLEALGTLAGGVAHELNNSLMTILGAASQLAEALPHRDSSLEDLLTAARRSQTVTRNLLTFTHPERVRTANVDLSACVRQVTTLLEPSAADRVTFALELEEPLPAVRGDAQQLAHAIMNLCVNAIQASPPGSSVTLRTHHVNVQTPGTPLLAAGFHVVLEVEDHGCGMDAATQARAFEPFFTTKAVGEGTGLGLSTVYGIVQEHHGAVELDSALGRGTTARLWFPVTPEAAQELTDVAPAGQRNSLPTRPVVLVVDDEPLVRTAARRLLRSLNYEVVTAENGEHALQLVAERAEIAAVLLDMAMPGMGGPACFRALRQLRGDLPVVVSTGYAAPHDAQSLLGEALTSFLPKPYDRHQLAEILRSLLQSGHG